MSVYLAEFIGTAILVLLGDGVVANVLLKDSKGEGGGGGGAWMTIATGWGLAVAVAVYSVGWISGAHINPAVTFGLATIGEFSWGQVPGYMLAQLGGAAFGALLVFAAYYGHFANTPDPGLKLAVFSTGPAIRKPGLNITTEVIGTALLVFGVLAIFENAVPLEDIGEAAGGVDLALLFSTGIGPLLVGFLVWAIGLSLGGPTGYAINPARDLGPRIMHAVLPVPGKGGSDWEYGWIPVVAPLAGGAVGALAFQAAF